MQACHGFVFECFPNIPSSVRSQLRFGPYLRREPSKWSKHQTDSCHSKCSS